MKKQIIGLSAIYLLCISCSTDSTKDVVPQKIDNSPVSYQKDVSPIIQNQCISCHGASNPIGGISLTNYTEVKTEINNVIDRISRNSSEPGYMPQGGIISTININTIKNWQTDGLLE